MATDVAHGTQAALTIGTETTLNGASFTSPGVYVCEIDTTNLAGGDVLEFRAYAKVLTGGSEILAYYAAYVNAQSSPMKITIPIASGYSCRFTLKQTAGTGRAFDFVIYTL